MSAEVRDILEAGSTNPKQRQDGAESGSRQAPADAQLTSPELGHFTFPSRHIGPSEDEVFQMLQTIGVESLDKLVDSTVPESIRMRADLKLSASPGEREVLAELRGIASENRVLRSYLGQGFNNCITPAVIQRTILENPGWYTQYTPYQAEISQGRLEALLNFQTMIADLTAMDLANASLLDEGTAAAEAMTLCYRYLAAEGKTAGAAASERRKFFVSDGVHPTSIEVLRGRAEPLGFELVIGDHREFTPSEEFFAALVQYPATDGEVCDFRELAQALHAKGALLIAAADLLSLVMLTPPGEWGADVVVGNSQRFGVPLGGGGPHAAFMAVRDALKRDMPGRLVGVSKDAAGKPAYRLALQTREQHIRREKATSNICTAQVLLAIIASMYGVYHGPDGLRKIARRVNRYTGELAKRLHALGIELKTTQFFDTLRTRPLGEAAGRVAKKARELGINLREFSDGSLGVSLDETVRPADLDDLVEAFRASAPQQAPEQTPQQTPDGSSFELADEHRRKSDFLTHPVFNSYHSETELLRYIKRLEGRDLSLTTSMIPLGSCTMKLNAAVEMYPISWPEFSQIHPFAPADQVQGFAKLAESLEAMLAEITGMHAVSLQPNAGSQGEYAGLLVIRAFQRERGEQSRNVCLIPQSAHGTNPATAAMAGMEVVVVRCDSAGNIDVEDLEEKAAQYQDRLSALMVTYPSTHGVFEESIVKICEIVHRCGGQVYMDGANLNAQVGLCRPGDFGVDVCHLNLHKTFCIPHGGGGPGVGPIASRSHLAPFLPGHIYTSVGGDKGIRSVCTAPWGSVSILPIPWVYIRLMGARGLRRATKVAILNANYIAKRLEGHFSVLYKGKNAMVAHECILDLRSFKRAVGIDVSDVAKRLMDYGFHAPTVSFPVAETLMVEPTESESKQELDRFCDALIAIRREIAEVENGQADKKDNVLKNAPHTAQEVSSDDWQHAYSRTKAAYPLPWLEDHKFWPSVGRIDNSYGDRNLFCSCVPLSE